LRLEVLNAQDPRKAEICHTCMGNKHAYAGRAVPMNRRRFLRETLGTLTAAAVVGLPE